jgi:hypothetical protein
MNAPFGDPPADDGDREALVEVLEDDEAVEREDVEVLPEADELLPEAEELLPEAEELLPEAEVVPEAVELLPEDDVPPDVPLPDDVPPAAADAVPLGGVVVVGAVR